MILQLNSVSLEMSEQMGIKKITIWSLKQYEIALHL